MPAATAHKDGATGSTSYPARRGGASRVGVEQCTESVVPEAMDGLDIFDDPTETLRQALNELNALIDAGQEASSSSRFAQAWRQRDCILLELEERNASEAVLAPMLQASAAQPHARAREPPRSITTPAAPTRLLPAAAPLATGAHQPPRDGSSPRNTPPAAMSLQQRIRAAAKAEKQQAAKQRAAAAERAEAAERAAVEERAAALERAAAAQRAAKERLALAKRERVAEQRRAEAAAPQAAPPAAPSAACPPSATEGREGREAREAREARLAPQGRAPPKPAGAARGGGAAASQVAVPSAASAWQAHAQLS